MILDAWGWCTGTTQRDGVGTEEGGGFRMGEKKEKKKKKKHISHVGHAQLPLCKEMLQYKKPL